MQAQLAARLVRFLTALLGMFVFFADAACAGDDGPAPLNVTSEAYAVPLSALAQQDPPQLTLQWTTEPNATSFQVFRKKLKDKKWTPLTEQLSAATTTFTDTRIRAGQAYEYRVVKNAIEAASGFAYTGAGFVYAGIAAPLPEQRGRILLLVESSIASALSAEVARLRDDLIGDGWLVVLLNADRAASVADVKALIQAEFAKDKKNTRALLLLGHLPVPYSGNYNIEGHNADGHEDHEGAWPADAYYGDMDGTWTDTTVNNTRAARPKNHNVPGDGKFDQTLLPSPVELQVGRVDLFDLPAFGLSEIELLRRYLNKNHAFRHKQLTPPERGLVQDHFAARREAFGANGWRNIAATVGTANVIAADFLPALTSAPYLWAYGAGPGSFTAADGIAATPDFATRDIQAVFFMLFGSYFGDWDSQDNFLRAPLAAANYGLASMWVGRPNWFFQHLALGETLGFSAQLTQNNRGELYPSTDYAPRDAAGFALTALMGDPTLRLQYVAPVTNLTATRAGRGIELSWTASSDANIAGYHVFRADSAEGPFERRTRKPIAGTTFTDRAGKGTPVYMVRAVKLQTSGGGSYFNASQGVFVQSRLATAKNGAF